MREGGGGDGGVLFTVCERKCVVCAGYPVVSAAHVALRTIRQWLEDEKYAEKVRHSSCFSYKKLVT